MKTLISTEYNPTSGITTEYWSEDEGKRIHVRMLQDVEPGFKQNARELNLKSAKSRFNKNDGIGTKVASIPMGLVEKLAQDGLNIVTCSEKELNKLLNDPDFSKIRTAHGRV